MMQLLYCFVLFISFPIVFILYLLIYMCRRLGAQMLFATISLDILLKRIDTFQFIQFLRK